MNRSLRIALLSLLLVAVLVFSVCCTPSDRVGVDSSGLDPFVIGGIGPLTGIYGSYGISVMRGAQIAVEEINATGGVNGFRLVLNFQDSEADPSTAVSVYHKLKDNDMQVLLGGVFSAETEALSAAAREDGMLLVTPTAGDPDALGGGWNAFRICLDTPRLGATVASYFTARFPSGTFAVVYSENEFGGDAAQSAFLDGVKDSGARVIRILAENLRTELEDVVEVLEKSAVDGIFLALSPGETELFLREYEGEGQIVSTQFPSDLSDCEGVGLVSAYYPEEKNTVSSHFASVYRSAYAAAPDRYAADAYDAVYAIAEAIKRAGLRPEDTDRGAVNERLTEAMTRIEVVGITGTISWTADGENNRNASLRFLRNGSFVPASDENANTP